MHTERQLHAWTATRTEIRQRAHTCKYNHTHTHAYMESVWLDVCPAAGTLGHRAGNINESRLFPQIKNEETF